MAEYAADPPEIGRGDIPFRIARSIESGSTDQMPETPHKTSQQIDYLIDKLNTRWNLQIPRIHGAAAEKAGDGPDLAKKCSSRIRALCWSGNVDMDSVLEEFEDKIKHLYSHWKWKPLQQNGTLLSLPATKSFLRQDAISLSQALTPKQRQTLLEVLFGLLEEEYKLTTDSDLYQRAPAESVRSSTSTASRESLRSSSAHTFHTASEHRSITLDAKVTKNMTKTASLSEHGSIKRVASQIAVNSSKRKKKTQITPTTKPQDERLSVHEMILRQNSFRPPKQSFDSFEAPNASFHASSNIESFATNASEEPPNIQSFTTNASEQPQNVFSDSEISPSTSNATSFMSVDGGDDKNRRGTEISGTQYSGETEVMEFADEDARLCGLAMKPNPKPPPQSVESMLRSLPVDGPFKPARHVLPPDIPYWYAFEIYRISHSLSLDVNTFWLLISARLETHKPSLGDFWALAKAICQKVQFYRTAEENTTSTMPMKSSIPGWTTSQNLYCDEDSGKSIQLTAKLDFAEKHENRLFNFKLNPVQYEKSCRFHRHFGADRFLTIDMPFFDQKSVPKHLKNVSTLHNQIYEWLTTNELHIAGRQWRAFYAEPFKGRSKNRRQEEGARQRLHLFAVNGSDFNQLFRTHYERHKPLRLLQFLQWHLVFEHNVRSTDMKLFARIQLGLSKTLATIVLEPHEFIHIPDILPQDERGQDILDGTVMTDGCARISFPLARAVWALHNRPGQDVPSAFQARIGGAKGLWHVDYTDNHRDVGVRGFWIEIRDSQLKIKHDPKIRVHPDEKQRAFEVVKHSTSCEPGHLNIQLINIMHHCGTSRNSLATALYEDLKEYLDSLKVAMQDPLKLRVWLQTHHRAASGHEEIQFNGGMPESTEDELDYMLESGFSPDKCRYLVTRLKSLIKQELDSYVDKLRIKVESSTSVFCIPDPSGKLAPGEIQLNFSQAKIDPRSKLSELHLESPKVLVARNPAHLPSDIQLVKAVYYHELRHLKDVVIFSTKGRTPLADLLSGGDYDGDTVTVIWDPKLTAGFKNQPKPKLASRKECGVKSQTQMVSEIFEKGKPTPSQAQAFVHKCCSLNGTQSLLGEVTIEHERLLYANLENIEKSGPQMLAALAGYLVDSAKQGDSFSSEDWIFLRNRIRKECGIQVLPEPAYKSGDKARARKGEKECKNIIDHLKFDVAEGLRDSVLTLYEVNYTSRTESKDEDVVNHYHMEQDRRAKLKPEERQATQKVFKALDEQLQQIRTEWGRRCGKEEDGIPGQEFGNKAARESFQHIVSELGERIRAIEPLDINCGIRREFERNRGARATRWELLRASWMHFYFPEGSMAWKLVGDDLCTIKARANGRTWEMTMAARQIMKADVKRFKRLYGEDEIGNNGMDVYDYDD